MGSKILSVVVVVIVVALVGASGYYLFTTYFDEGETTISSYNINLYTFNANLDLLNVNYAPVNSNQAWLTYDSYLSIKDDKDMNIAFKYPQDFSLEFRNSPHVLNIFQPSDNPESNLDNARIFVNYYEADDFQARYLTEIQQTEDLEIGNLAAKKYLAIKKDDPVEDRPEWLVLEHMVIEVLNQGRIYTIDFYSQLENNIIDEFLATVSF